MGKEKKSDIDAGMPDDAIRVKEIGSWTVFFSKSKTSAYFRSASYPAALLRLTRDDLLRLAQGMAIWCSIEKEASVLQEKKIQSDKNLKEKRRLKRFARRCECKFMSEGISHKGIASDFSLNGLFINTAYPPAADAVIGIAVHLPDGSVSSLQGKVRRTMKTPPGRVTGRPLKEHKSGMGVELLMKDANYLNFIRSLIK